MSSQASAPRRLAAARFAGIPELELAYSDFTDTYDLTDGDGTRPASAGLHIKRLQESLVAMGYTLPNGINGVYDAATRGVVLQLQIDAGHPRPAGHEWEHILGIGGPNTLAHFDMFDPGPTISDPDLGATGVAATRITFAESPDNPFAGLDSSTSPASLVVGAQQRRRVRVESVPAVSDVAFASADPAIASVARIDGGIVVGGNKPGITIVRATSGGKMLAALNVAVKAPREERVNFFFVSGAAAPFASARTHDQANFLTLRLNRVWRRQANVHFMLGEVRDIAAPRSRGPAFGPGDADLFRALAKPGELNVFCVGQWDGDGVPVGGNMLFLVDKDCADGMGVPHGAGYYLGFAGPAPGSGIMAHCAEGVDRQRVSKAIADVVNP